MVLRTEIPMVMVTQTIMGTVTTAGRHLGTSNLNNIQSTWLLHMTVSNVCLSAMKTLNVPNRPGLIAPTMNGSAPCCGAAFGCRICHDDSPILPPLLMMKQVCRYPRSSSLPGSFTTMAQTPEDTHHNIDRFAVKEVICRECCTKQSANT
jgi:hypothetical protein